MCITYVYIYIICLLWNKEILLKKDVKTWQPPFNTEEKRQYSLGKSSHSMLNLYMMKSNFIQTKIFSVFVIHADLSALLLKINPKVMYCWYYCLRTVPLHILTCACSKVYLCWYKILLKRPRWKNILFFFILLLLPLRRSWGKESFFDFFLIQIFTRRAILGYYIVINFT